MTGYLHTFLSSVFLSYLLTEMTKVTSIWRLFLQLIFQQKIYQYFVFYSADSIPNRRVTSHFNFNFSVKKVQTQYHVFQMILYWLERFPKRKIFILPKRWSLEKSFELLELFFMHWYYLSRLCHILLFRWRILVLMRTLFWSD